MEVYIVEDLVNEEWKPIEYYPMYYVSNMGRIKRTAYEKFYHKNHNLVFRAEKLIKQQNRNGYMQVTLIGEYGRKELRVNRLVAQAFIPNPDNLPIVNHLNEDKTDNRVENLEWASAERNANWATRNNRIARSNTGKTFSDEHRANLSRAMQGNTNRKGYRNSKKQIEAAAKAHSKPVLCDGLRFNSVKQAAEYYKADYRSFARWLRGDRPMPDKYKQMGLRYE